MFDRIARRYDVLNRVLSLGLDHAWRRKLVKTLDVDVAAKILDVATGTADLALSIAEGYPRARVIGIDPSPKMLEYGREKVATRGLSDRIELREGDAQALPFDDHTFDATVVSFGIRNVPDRAKALREMVRVTRPLGKVVVLELSEPTDGLLASLARFHVHHLVPRIGALLSGAPEYRYLQDSIEAFPPPDVFVQSMHEAGLINVSAKKLTFGVVYMYVGETTGSS